ncbi:hypothetical protein [Fluviicola sp.]|uniref:hypothetical protein n=1 Tax=Fluviicola sp. TaxID=1917219 RepID=UPI0031DB5DB3
MTTEEKDVLLEIFKKLKGLYYRQKVTDDTIERILRKLPDDTLPIEVLDRIERTDGKLTQVELEDLEKRIQNITIN